MFAFNQLRIASFSSCKNSRQRRVRHCGLGESGRRKRLASAVGHIPRPTKAIRRSPTPGRSGDFISPGFDLGPWAYTAESAPMKSVPGTRILSGASILAPFAPSGSTNRSGELAMDRIWLKNYPQGVPHEIDPRAYASLAEVVRAGRRALPRPPRVHQHGCDAHLCRGRPQEPRARGVSAAALRSRRRATASRS